LLANPPAAAVWRASDGSRFRSCHVGHPARRRPSAQIEAEEPIEPQAGAPAALFEGWSV